MSDLINAPEVARLCGINETTVRKNATNGSLGFKGVRIGGLWKFSRAEILEHLQKLKNQATKQQQTTKKEVKKWKC